MNGLTQRWAGAPLKSRGPAWPARMWFYGWDPWSTASAAMMGYKQNIMISKHLVGQIWLHASHGCLIEIICLNFINNLQLSNSMGMRTHQVECFAVWFDFMFLHVLYKAAVCVSETDRAHIGEYLAFSAVIQYESIHDNHIIRNNLWRHSNRYLRHQTCVANCFAFWFKRTRTQSS